MPKLRVFYALVEEYEGQWTITFPDLPGVTAIAESRDEVIAAGDEALHRALAENPDVYPSSYFDISQRASIRLALQLGKELVAMPE